MANSRMQNFFWTPTKCPHRKWMCHVLFAKKMEKIRQIWPQRLLKHFTAAYRGFPPSYQQQYTRYGGITPEGGGMVNRGPPFCPLRGGSTPWVDPTPYRLPVLHRMERKFPRVINPESSLNYSRRLECPPSRPPFCNYSL